MRIGIVAAWVLAVAAVARTADAQSSTPTAPKVDVWAGMCAAGRAPAGRLVTTYAPPLLPAGEFSSRGGQTLTLDRRRALSRAASTCLPDRMSAFRFWPAGRRLISAAPTGHTGST